MICRSGTYQESASKARALRALLDAQMPPGQPIRRLLPKLGARDARSLAHCAGRHRQLQPRSCWLRPARTASSRQLSTQQQPAHADADGGGPSGRGSAPLFALATTDSKYLDTSFAARLFCKLELSSFSEAELRRAFERTATGGTGKLSREEIRAMLLHEEQGRVCPRMLDSQVEATTAHLLSSAPSGLLSFGEFKEKITALAERRDPRIWPIAASMLLSGTAVGVVLPVMPMLVHHLGLSQAAYGLTLALTLTLTRTPNPNPNPNPKPNPNPNQVATVQAFEAHLDMIVACAEAFYLIRVHVGVGQCCRAVDAESPAL